MRKLILSVSLLLALLCTSLPLLTLADSSGMTGAWCDPNLSGVVSDMQTGFGGIVGAGMGQTSCWSYNGYEDSTGTKFVLGFYGIIPSFTYLDQYFSHDTTGSVTINFLPVTSLWTALLQQTGVVTPSVTNNTVDFWVIADGIVKHVNQTGGGSVTVPLAYFDTGDQVKIECGGTTAQRFEGFLCSTGAAITSVTTSGFVDPNAYFATPTPVLVPGGNPSPTPTPTGPPSPCFSYPPSYNTATISPCSGPAPVNFYLTMKSVLHGAGASCAIYWILPNGSLGATIALANCGTSGVSGSYTVPYVGGAGAHYLGYFNNNTNYHDGEDAAFPVCEYNGVDYTEQEYTQDYTNFPNWCASFVPPTPRPTSTPASFVTATPQGMSYTTPTVEATVVSTSTNPTCWFWCSGGPDFPQLFGNVWQSITGIGSIFSGWHLPSLFQSLFSPLKTMLNFMNNFFNWALPQLVPQSLGNDIQPVITALKNKWNFATPGISIGSGTGCFIGWEGINFENILNNVNFGFNPCSMPNVNIMRNVELWIFDLSVWSAVVFMIFDTTSAPAGNPSTPTAGVASSGYMPGTAAPPTVNLGMGP